MEYNNFIVLSFCHWKLKSYRKAHFILLNHGWEIVKKKRGLFHTQFFIKQTE